MSKNITPGLPRYQGKTRIKGKALQFYSPKYQRWITRSWPRGQGADTEKRALQRADFSSAVKLIKQVDPSEYQDAMDLSKGTPYLYRDLLMKAATGTLISFTDDTGRFWMPTRDAIQSIQPMLDSISAVPGSLLFRNSNFWAYVPPPSQDSILEYSQSTNNLDWVAADAFITASLDAISSDPGAILYRDPTGWIALPPGAAGQVLGMDPTGQFPEWISPSGGGGDLQLIGHAIATGGNTTTTLSVGSIPNTGKHLLIEAQLRTNNASTVQVPQLRFNADSAAHYDWYVENRFGNGFSGNQTAMRCGSVNNSAATAGQFAANTIKVLNYAQTAIPPSMLSDSLCDLGSGRFFQQTAGWYHGGTAAIGSIDMTVDAGYAFIDGSIMSVYMEK